MTVNFVTLITSNKNIVLLNTCNWLLSLYCFIFCLTHIYGCQDMYDEVWNYCISDGQLCDLCTITRHVLRIVNICNKRT